MTVWQTDRHIATAQFALWIASRGKNYAPLLWLMHENNQQNPANCIVSLLCAVAHNSYAHCITAMSGVSVCLSVCPFVCPSHAGTKSPSSSPENLVFEYKFRTVGHRGTPIAGALNDTVVDKNSEKKRKVPSFTSQYLRNVGQYDTLLLLMFRSIQYNTILIG